LGKLGLLKLTLLQHPLVLSLGLLLLHLKHELVLSSSLSLSKLALGKLGLFLGHLAGVLAGLPILLTTTLLLATLPLTLLLLLLL
jgi:hypothetical protein